MAAYSDINGFPEAGFPVLSDVSDRVCLNTLYWNPLKEAGFILDVVGNNSLAGNLSLAGMLSGVTSITMNGALSGVSTITANGTATLTSSNPLSLTDVNANIRMPGLNSSIGSVLERVYKGYFKNLDVANTLTVNGDDVALIGDIKRYVSGTLNTLPKYNATGITDSKFTDDGTTPKYNANTIWHAGNSNLHTVDWTVKDLSIHGDALSSLQKSHFFYTSNYGIGTPDAAGLQIFTGDTIRFGKRNLGVFTEWARFDNAGDLKIGSLSGYLKATAGVVGAVSSIPESDISFTDITTGNVSTSKHGYFPKLPTPTGKYLRDDLTWQNVSGGTGVPGGLDKQVQWNDNGSFAGIIGTSVQNYYNSQQAVVFSGEGTGFIFTDVSSNATNGFAMRSGSDLAIHLGYAGSGDSGYMAPFDFRFNDGILGWNGSVTPTTWALKYASIIGGGTIGFFNTAPISKPTATGSKGGNAALASLLTQLSNLGLITDSTT